MYQGKFSPKNPKKYQGDLSQIYYRSGWELSCMLWFDSHPSVMEWSSEEIVIPYVCVTDKKWHRYFIDFKVKFEDGIIVLVEVKPKAQTKQPVQGKKRKQTFLKEVFTYGKNISKWRQAKEYAEDRGYRFEVWTEDTLKKLGIPMLEAFKKKKT